MSTSVSLRWKTSQHDFLSGALWWAMLLLITSLIPSLIKTQNMRGVGLLSSTFRFAGRVPSASLKQLTTYLICFSPCLYWALFCICQPCCRANTSSFFRKQNTASLTHSALPIVRRSGKLAFLAQVQHYFHPYCSGVKEVQPGLQEDSHIREVVAKLHVTLNLQHTKR